MPKKASKRVKEIQSVQPCEITFFLKEKTLEEDKPKKFKYDDFDVNLSNTNCTQVNKKPSVNDKTLSDYMWYFIIKDKKMEEAEMNGSRIRVVKPTELNESKPANHNHLSPDVVNQPELTEKIQNENSKTQFVYNPELSICNLENELTQEDLDEWLNTTKYT